MITVIIDKKHFAFIETKHLDKQPKRYLID
jgi:hypothetical protein